MSYDSQQSNADLSLAPTVPVFPVVAENAPRTWEKNNQTQQ